MGIIDGIKETLGKLTKSSHPFDPSTLNDELAMKTEWVPAKRGGTNMCTHRLEQISTKRMEFKVRGMVLFFPLIFMVAGIVSGVGMAIVGGKENIVFAFISIPFGATFFLAGFFILRSWQTPRVFDYGADYYWKGRVQPDPFNIGDIKDFCPLTEIYAIQLLKEHCTSSSSNGGDSSYYSYELNLVLKDASRLNVVDHGKRSVIQSDAETLSRFLNVPLWNAIL